MQLSKRLVYDVPTAFFNIERWLTRGSHAPLLQLHGGISDDLSGQTQEPGDIDMHLKSLTDKQLLAVFFIVTL